MSVRETIKEAYERLHRMETDEIVDYAYNLEQENKELKELCDKYEEENGTTFKIWLKTIDKLKKIEELCIENIESCASAIGNPDYTIISKTKLLSNEIDKNKNILKIIKGDD